MTDRHHQSNPSEGCRDECIANELCVAYETAGGNCTHFGKEAWTTDGDAAEGAKSCFLTGRKPVQCLQADIPDEYRNFVDVTPDSSGG